MIPRGDPGKLADRREPSDDGAWRPTDGDDDPARDRVLAALVGVSWAAGLLLWILLASLAVGNWARLAWPDLVVILPIGAATGAFVARPRSGAGEPGGPATTVARAGVLVSVALLGVAVAVPREPTLAWSALLAGTAIPLLAGVLAVAADRPGLVRGVAGGASLAGVASLVLGVVWMTAGPGMGFATPTLRTFLVVAAVVLVATPAVGARAGRALASVRERHPHPGLGPHLEARTAWTLAGGLLGLAWAVVLRLGMSALVIVDGGLTSFDSTLTTLAILLPAVVTGAGWGWAAHARRHGSSTSPRWGAIAALAFLLVPVATVDGIVGMLTSGQGVQLVLVPVLLVVGGLAMAARRRWPHLLVAVLLGIGAAVLLDQGPGGWPLPSAGMAAATVALVGGFGIAFVAGAEPFRPALAAPRAVPKLTAATPPAAGA